MTESIAVAVITGVLAVFGTWVGNVSVSRKKTREDAVREARRDQELKDRLDRLENKVDEHNGWGAKFSDTIIVLEGIKKDIEWLKKNGK